MAKTALQQLLAPEDRRPLKVAWVAALIAHFLMFGVVFPDISRTLQAEMRQEAVVIKRYQPPEPPKQQPEKKVVKKKTARVPIPDPTPDEPEPIVEEAVEYIETEVERADTEFFISGPPSGPPVIEPEGPLRVGGEIQAPTKLVHVDPLYPELARRARLAGTLVLEATIDREGNVVDVKVLRGLGLGLEEAAITAVSQWKYTPTIYNGRPVEVRMGVTVLFQLQ